MSRYKISGIALLGLALLVTGCGKKSTDQAALSGTGYDSLSSSTELAQLPQASGSNSSNQQAGVEVLPIEASPVTQSAATTAPAATEAPGTTAAATTTTSSTLTRDQQVQTALKNAGIYQGKIDGKIGPRTKQAIEQFQTSHGLKADGKVGPKTWAALQSYLNEQQPAAE